MIGRRETPCRKGTLHKRGALLVPGPAANPGCGFVEAAI